MTTDDSRPLIDHATRCQRRGAPILRLSWAGRPQVFCGACGRYADLPDPDPQPERTQP